jgi:hypothetical protein
MKSAGTSVAGYPESIAKSYNGRRHRRIIEPVLPTPEQLSDQTDFDLKTPDAYKFRREIKPRTIMHHAHLATLPAAAPVIHSTNLFFAVKNGAQRAEVI